MDTVMFSLKDLGWIILCIALLILIIYLIMAFANLIKTLKKTNAILDDVKVVTEVASNKAVAINDMITGATEELKGFLESLNPAFRNILQAITDRITEGGKNKTEKKRIKEAQKAARKAAREASMQTSDNDVKVQEFQTAKLDDNRIR